MRRVPGWLPRVLVHALVGAVLGVAAAVAVIVFGYAVLWLFVFGDDSWPAGAGLALTIVGYGAGLALFIGAVWMGFRTRSR